MVKEKELGSHESWQKDGLEWRMGFFFPREMKNPYVLVLMVWTFAELLRMIFL